MCLQNPQSMACIRITRLMFLMKKTKCPTHVVINLQFTVSCTRGKGKRFRVRVEGRVEKIEWKNAYWPCSFHQIGYRCRWRGEEAMEPKMHRRHKSSKACNKVAEEDTQQQLRLLELARPYEAWLNCESINYPSTTSTPNPNHPEGEATYRNCEWLILCDDVICFEVVDAEAKTPPKEPPWSAVSWLSNELTPTLRLWHRRGVVWKILRPYKRCPRAIP